MNKLVCITGLPGAGKTTVSDIFIDKGFKYIRFGQVVMDEIKSKNLEVNEENERIVREALRGKHGMGAMAKLNVNKIKKLLNQNNVIADGLYSFEEYKILKSEFNDQFYLIAVYAPPKIRYERLEERKERKLTYDEARSRDYSEIEVLNKGGAIAMADWTIVNVSTKRYLEKDTVKIISQL